MSTKPQNMVETPIPRNIIIIIPTDDHLSANLPAGNAIKPMRRDAGNQSSYSFSKDDSQERSIAITIVKYIAAK